jgi:hypothetical protein
MNRILGVLLFFPSVLILPLDGTEIFPYGIIFALFFRRIGKVCAPEMILVLSVMYGAAVGIVTQAPLGEFLRSLAAYLNVLAPTIYLLSHKEASLEVLRCVPAVFWTMSSIGFIQLSGAIPEGADEIVRLIIPRFSSSFELGDNNRGARLLSSEPARAGYEFVVVSMLYLWSKHNKGRKIGVELLVSLLVTIFVIRSGTAIFVLLIGLLAFAPVQGLLVVSIASAVGITLMPLELLGRGTWLVREVLSRSDLLDIFYFLLDQSGFRLISNLAAYLAFLHNPFGFGVGQWQTSSLVMMESLEIPLEAVSTFASAGEFTGVRASSYFGQIVLDAGLIGLLASVYFIARRAPVAVGDRWTRSLFAVFLGVTMIVGDAGNPIPWAGLALMISCRMVKEPQSLAAVGEAGILKVTTVPRMFPMS